jgi:hypothetical protein
MNVTATGPATVPAGTGLVFVRVPVSTPGAVNINLPATGSVRIIDRGPRAGTFPITIIPPSGRTINGGANWVIATDWGVANIIFDGSNYAVG